MTAANGGAAQVMNWSRLYLAPAWATARGGAAALDSFDLLGAVVDWVEKGTAPDAVTATGRAFPGRSRPMCAYPKHAQYKGSGDIEDAKNFDCRETLSLDGVREDFNRADVRPSVAVAENSLAACGEA